MKEVLTNDVASNFTWHGKDTGHAQVGVALFNRQITNAFYGSYYLLFFIYAMDVGVQPFKIRVFKDKVATAQKNMISNTEFLSFCKS